MSAASADNPIRYEEVAALFPGLEEFRHLAIAVSGGADSMALLRLTARWAAEQADAPLLTALTVDHGLRADSADEAERVAGWCAAIEVDHVTLRWGGPKPATRVQERAREARYALMTEWCRANGAGALVTAHTLEDQAETVLMRLARASGVDGLAGMAPRSERDGIALLRPLLGVPKDRLRANLAELGQDVIDDPSNADTRFERVRLRAAMPALTEVGLDARTLCGAARKAARAADALEQIAARAFVRCAAVEPAGYVRLDPAALAGEPQEIRLRVLTRVLALVGRRARPSAVAVERAEAMLLASDFAGLTCAGCRVVTHGSGILIVREARDLPRLTLEPGRTEGWDRRFELTLGADQGTVDIAALGRRAFARLRRNHPDWAGIPALVGAVLPAGFRDGALALVPELHDDNKAAALRARFIVPGSP